MFPSGLLQSVTTLKTFTPDQQGDFAGALVDIRTKEFPAQRSVTLQMSGGYAPDVDAIVTIHVNTIREAIAVSCTDLWRSASAS